MSTQGSGTGLRSKITFDMFHIYCTSVYICDSFDVQHDHVLKKLNFDLLRGEGGCGEKNCYHNAVLAIPFKLICSMIMF